MRIFSIILSSIILFSWTPFYAASPLCNFEADFPGKRDLEGCDFAWHSRLSPLARDYLDQIRNKQNDSALNRKLIFSSAGHNGYGSPVGSLMINMLKGMSVAFATNRKFVFAPEDEFWYAPRRVHPNNTWHYFFQRQGLDLTSPSSIPPVSTQSTLSKAIYHLHPLDIFNSDMQDVWNFYQTWSFSSSKNLLMDIWESDQLQLASHGDANFYKNYHPGRHAEEEATAAPDGSWVHVESLRLSAWKSALATHLFCPQLWVLEKLYCKLQAMGLQSRGYIAIHIRRGDKVSGPQLYPKYARSGEEGVAIPVRRYFQEADRIRRDSSGYLGGTRPCCGKVLASFDDPKILPEIEAAAKEYGFELVHDKSASKIQRGQPLVNLPNSQGVSDEAREEDMMNVLLILVSFVEAFALVGADMSAVFRLARYLRGLDNPEDVAGVSLLHNLLHEI